MEATNKRERVLSIGNMTKMAIFAAVAGVLMLIKFPIPIAPPFMTVDLGDVATLISGFILGPASGIITVVLKNLINLILNGTTTAYVGEISNIIVGATFIGISSYIYHRYKTKKSAIKGLFFGVIAMTIVATLSNYFVIFPMYSKILNIPLEGFVDFVPKFNKLVNSYLDVILFAVVPFNLFKGALNAIVTFLVYKKVSKFMKSI